jgi:anti-sigma-K factor RskA
VWRAIEARLAPRGVGAAPGFWRSLALLSGGVASVLLAAFLWVSSGPRGEPLFVAVLVEANAAPRMVLSMHRPDLLRVRMVKPWAGMRNQSLELWALPAEGAPRSLGLVANEMRDTMIRIAPDDPRVQGAKMFAITMEPEGGSPTRQPTGSIVCSGAMAPVRRG